MNQNLTVKLDESYNKGGLKKYNVRNHPDKLTAIFVDKNELIVKLEYIDNGIKEFIYENNLVVEEKEIDVDLGEYSIKYKYDDRGNIILKMSDQLIESFGYDDNNNLIAKIKNNSSSIYKYKDNILIQEKVIFKNDFYQIYPENNITKYIPELKNFVRAEISEFEDVVCYVINTTLYIPEYELLSQNNLFKYFSDKEINSLKK